MRHCCKFNPDEVYYLTDTEKYEHRKLSIGFCPICSKPVAELYEWRFDGKPKFITVSGIAANSLVLEHKDEILYSMKECNYRKIKSKPYGWKYGVNKTIKVRGKELCRQFAYDFYGNKELIKTI